MESNPEVHYRHMPPWKLYTLYACVWTSTTLSIVGSSFILRAIVRNRHRTNAFQRLMFGLSVSDLSNAIIMGLQPLLIPSVTQLPVASGTVATCRFLGFGTMFVLTSYMFSCAISYHFYLVVTSDGRKQIWEPYCHLLPWATGFLFGILGLVFQSFGFELLLGICVFHCGNTADEGSECPNGPSRYAVSIIGWGFSAVALLAGIGGVVFTVLVYIHTRRIYRNSQRHAFPGSFQSDFRYAQKRAITGRSILYTGAFMNSFLVNLVGSCVNEVYKENVQNGNDSNTIVFIIMILMFCGFPIQGFLNCIVYFQPMVSRWRERNASKSVVWAIGKALVDPDESSSTHALPTTERRGSFRSVSDFFFPSSSRVLHHARGDAIEEPSDDIIDRNTEVRFDETFASEGKASSSEDAIDGS